MAGERTALGPAVEQNVRLRPAQNTPEFMIGIGLYLFSLRYSLKWCGQVFMGGCVVALFCGLLLEIRDWIAVPLFAFMIYATAELSRTGQKNFLFENSSVYLGEISYSLYMIQYPFMFIVFDTILERGLGLEENSKIWGYFWAAAPSLWCFWPWLCTNISKALAGIGL